MDNDLISRSALIKRLEGIYKMAENEPIKTYANAIRLAIVETKLAPTVETVQAITGDTSDGYHTFNELYHHRAVLFSVIVKAFQEKAWKARLHHDGTMYDGMFIVGIDTPEGQASYHYDIDPYWDMFECRELERAPEWDGHTPAQAIERIGMLEPVRIGCWGVAEEEHYRAMECLEKMQFFMGQRAGRELWMSKPKNVQDVDIEQYNHDIKTVTHYTHQLENQIGKLEPVRHGRWIQSKTVPSYHYCSQCRVPQKMEKSCNIYVLIHYCPYCGAKMDGEKKGEGE